MKRLTILLLVLALSLGSLIALIEKPELFSSKKEIAGSSTSLNYNFGINSALPSFGANEAKMAIGASRIAKAHIGWSRIEFNYSSPMHFGYYDKAFFLQRDRGIRTLGLLSFPGSGTSMSSWRTYVNTTVKHYKNKIYAWEIMNEADVYLSSGDYAKYLSEAYNIIKANTPSATVVTSGITSRQEAADFIDGLASAGVWNKFDAVGLHIYHAGPPEQVNFGGGSVATEVSRIVGSINRNGGGKKIWITEIGYKGSEYGSTKQGNLLARAAIMARSFNEVDKIFFYRLYDNSGDKYGLLSEALKEKASYYKVANVVERFIGKRGAGGKIFTSYNVVDDNDPVPSGWNAGNTTNASLILGGDWGYNGMALTMEYYFDQGQDKAYTSSEKVMGDTWPPSAIGMWIKGDNSKNFWKFRMEDNEGETFQLDFGALSSDWQHVQFVFGQDPAITSWGGNGQIDYPLHFQSVLIDKMGGQDSGKGWIDRIGWLPDVDTYAYKFGDSVFYWKEKGSGYYRICGRKLLFNESVRYFKGGCQ